GFGRTPGPSPDVLQVGVASDRLAAEEPALEGLEELLSSEPLDRRNAAVLCRDARVVLERGVRALEGVLELVALEDVVIGVRLLAAPVLRIDGAADCPDRARLALDPDHHALLDSGVIDPFEHALCEDRARFRPLHARDPSAPHDAVSGLNRALSAKPN